MITYQCPTCRYEINEVQFRQIRYDYLALVVTIVR